MPYVAKRKASCKDKSRYLITREIVEIEDRRGAILDNSDRGKVMLVICESCKAPAHWKG